MVTARALRPDDGTAAPSRIARADPGRRTRGHAGVPAPRSVLAVRRSAGGAVRRGTGAPRPGSAGGPLRASSRAPLLVHAGVRAVRRPRLRQVGGDGPRERRLPRSRHGWRLAAPCPIHAGAGAGAARVVAAGGALRHERGARRRPAAARMRASSGCRSSGISFHASAPRIRFRSRPRRSSRPICASSKPSTTCSSPGSCRGRRGRRDPMSSGR